MKKSFLICFIIFFILVKFNLVKGFHEDPEYYYPVKNQNFTSDASNITDKNLTTQLNKETQPAKKNIIIPLTDPIAILNATSFFSCVDSGAEVTPSATVCNVTQVYASDDVREPLTNKKTNPWAWRNTTHNKTIPPGATINEVKVCVEWLGTSTTRDDGTEKCGFSAGYNYTGSWVWQPAYPSMPSFGDCGAISTTADVLNCSDMTSFFNTVEKINSAGVSVMHYEGTDATAGVRLYIDYVYLNVTYTPDQIPPVWSNQQQSTSIPGVGAQVKLSAYWTDNVAGLSHAWLATNETGSWENKTSIYLISFGGLISGWSNFTWQNSSIPNGTVVAWRIYANDSAGNENATNIMTFEVKPTYLLVNLTFPSPLTYTQTNPYEVVQNNSFWVNASVKCYSEGEGGNCGNVSASPRYNKTGIEPNEIINVTEDVPFYVISQSGWKFKRLINITENSGNTLNDYQVLVNLDAADLISAGKITQDYRDIRFTDTDGTTLLNYWIELPVKSNATTQQINTTAGINSVTYLLNTLGTTGYGNLYFILKNDTITAVGKKLNLIVNNKLIDTITVPSSSTHYTYSLTNLIDSNNITFWTLDALDSASIIGVSINYYNKTQRIWVKVPSIPASSTKTIYLYYGNPSATSASNQMLTGIAQLKEHRVTTYASGMVFNKPSNTEVREDSYSVGSTPVNDGHIFFVVPASWINGKYIRWKWDGYFSYTSARVVADAYILDGEYDRKSDTDFPNQNYIITKGNGRLQTLYQENTYGTWGPYTRDVQVSISPTLSYVTLFFTMPDRWNGQTVYLDIDFIEVNTGPDGAGNILTLHFFDPGAVVMEVTGTDNDYGLFRNYTSPEPTVNIGEEIATSTISCGTLIQECELSWLVNATGAINSIWTIDVNFSSSLKTISKNDTNDTYVEIITDTQPPIYSLNSTSSTIAGTPVSHNLYWQDNVALSYAIFSFDNCTGSLQNISEISLSGNSAWSNFTVVINDTVSCTIRWCVYANDTSNNWNGSSCQNPFSYVVTPNLPPTYSLSSITLPRVGTPVTHSLYWQDDVGLSGYIFSFDNCTGTLINDTWVAMTGTGNWSNVTKVINSTVGCRIRWQVFANDTVNNWNSSRIYTYYTQPELTKTLYFNFIPFLPNVTLRNKRFPYYLNESLNQVEVELHSNYLDSAVETCPETSPSAIGEPFENYACEFYAFYSPIFPWKVNITNITFRIYAAIQASATDKYWRFYVYDFDPLQETSALKGSTDCAITSTSTSAFTCSLNGFVMEKNHQIKIVPKSKSTGTTNTYLELYYGNNTFPSYVNISYVKYFNEIIINVNITNSTSFLYSNDKVFINISAVYDNGTIASGVSLDVEVQHPNGSVYSKSTITDSQGRANLVYPTDFNGALNQKGTYILKITANDGDVTSFYHEGFFVIDDRPNVTQVTSQIAFVDYSDTGIDEKTEKLGYYWVEPLFFDIIEHFGYRFDNIKYGNLHNLTFLNQYKAIVVPGIPIDFTVLQQDDMMNNLINFANNGGIVFWTGEIRQEFETYFGITKISLIDRTPDTANNRRGAITLNGTNFTVLDDRLNSSTPVFDTGTTMGDWASIGFDTKTGAQFCGSTYWPLAGITDCIVAYNRDSPTQIAYNVTSAISLAIIYNSTHTWNGGLTLKNYGDGYLIFSSLDLSTITENLISIPIVPVDFQSYTWRVHLLFSALEWAMKEKGNIVVKYWPYPNNILWAFFSRFDMVDSNDVQEGNINASRDYLKGGWDLQQTGDPPLALVTSADALRWYDFSGTVESYHTYHAVDASRLKDNLNTLISNYPNSGYKGGGFMGGTDWKNYHYQGTITLLAFKEADFRYTTHYTTDSPWPISLYFYNFTSKKVERTHTLHSVPGINVENGATCYAPTLEPRVLIFNSIHHFYGHNDPDPAGDVTCWQTQFQYVANKTYYWGKWNSSLIKTGWTPHEIYEYIIPLVRNVAIKNVSFSGNKITYYVDGPSTLPSFLNLSKSSYYSAIGLKASDYSYNVTNLTFAIVLPKSWEDARINESNLTILFDGQNITSYAKPIIRDVCGGSCDFKYIMHVIPTLSSHKVEIIAAGLVDTTPPTYSLNSTNSTIAGTAVRHSLYWQDNVGLSGYIFSFDNCTGTLINDTWVAMTGTGNWSNVTKVINSTVGCRIRWCVYANDTSNNWNGSSCQNPFSYVTTSAVYVEIIPSQALIDGILFGTTSPNQVKGALNNSGPSGETQYNITIGSTSTANIDLYSKISATLCTDCVVNSSASITSGSTNFSTNTTITTSWAIMGNLTLNCTNLAIGSNCWLRYYLQTPPTLLAGNYQVTYYFCGVYTGGSPSLCG